MMTVTMPCQYASGLVSNKDIHMDHVVIIDNLDE